MKLGVERGKISAVVSGATELHRSIRRQYQKNGGGRLRGQDKKRPIALISGVVARSKTGRRRTEAEEANRAHLFRNGLSNAYLQARGRVSLSKVPGFFAEAARLTTFERNRFSPYPVGFSYLTLLQEPRQRSLDFEIRWLSHRVASAAGELGVFLEEKSRIEESIAARNSLRALELVQNLEKVIGVSLWSISLTIALTQEIEGDDAQKAFVAGLRAKYKTAILPFYARYMSQRAESSVPIGWFLENARRRLASFAEGDIRTYLTYKITGEWPSARAEIATILRMEQNHHVVDIYETFVASLQVLTTLPWAKDLSPKILSALEVMSVHNEFRVEKLLWCHQAGMDHAHCSIVDSGPMDLLVRGNVQRSYRTAIRSLDAGRAPFHSLIVASLAGSAGGARNSTTRSGRRRRWLGLLRSLSLRADQPDGGDSGSPSDFARKFGHVFGASSYAVAIGAVVAAQNTNAFDRKFDLLRLASLNSPELGSFDVIAHSSERALADAIWSRLRPSDSKEFVRLFYDRNHPPAIQLEPSATVYAACCALHHSGNYDEIERRVPTGLDSGSAVVARLSALTALSAYAANGNLKRAASLISRELSRSARSPESLPIVSVFEGVRWEDIADHAGDISMSNALSAYAEIDANDHVHTIRNFALRKALQSLGVDRPSRIREIQHGLDHDELVYFLHKSCTPNVLDMLPSLHSSRSVMEERREICASLVQIDPRNGPDHKYDVLSLSKEIAVSQGLQTIDASRVHVDVAALRSILRRDLSDSFQRHLSLIKSGGTPVETFDSILRELAKPEISAKHLLSMPDSEADELLISMVFQTRERFLFNVPHGLDSYLSKRVRHGSIVGFLRAPAEAGGLITQQHSDGRYKENTRWERVISQSANPIELQKAFLSFARSYDQHLIRLKDVLLHVRSEEKPLGLFDARMPAPLFHLIRSVASTDRSLDAFVDTMLSSLRGLLAPSLKAAAEQISKETAAYIAVLFKDLRTSVQVHILAGQDRATLLAAINDTSASVQNAIASVATWFTPVAMEEAKFDMELVCEISLASVKSISNQFDPVITFDDKSNLSVGVQQLPFLQDVLFIILGNIAKWSNLQNPAIDISVEYNADKSILTFEVTNDAAFCRSLSDVRARLDEIKAVLSDKKYLDIARRESTSGLAKLASIVHQSEYGQLDFGLTEGNRFRLLTTLSIHAEKREDEDTDR